MTIVEAGAARRRAGEKVANQIRNQIVRGELTQSDTLPPEGALMEMFGVSRPTLREAIRILEGENLIVVSRGPRGGAKVMPFTPELAARTIGQTLQAGRTTLQDVFAARAIIEPPAAFMAATHQPKLAALALRKQIIAEYRMLGEVPGMAKTMSDFHISLVEVSGNQTLALLGRALQQIILTHMALLNYNAAQAVPPDERLARQRSALESHERLADLIGQGEAEAAQRHWAQHMERHIPLWLPPPLGASPLDVLEKPPVEIDRPQD